MRGGYEAMNEKNFCARPQFFAMVYADYASHLETNSGCTNMKSMLQLTWDISLAQVLLYFDFRSW
jgi:hypothetical protein